ncbi:MAG: permease [Rhodospirillales bacterium]|nr:permease [Rhodospirillales bacterium]
MNALYAVAATWPRKAMEFDRAWLAVGVVIAAVAVLDPTQMRPSAVFTAVAVAGVLPFLLLSVAIAAYAKASGADNLIGRAFQGRIVAMIGFAAAMGALSPFCSCGVIPLIAALLVMGVPLAPVMAFWLASPLMDPSMFVLTAGTLGGGFAVAKTAAALAIGVMGGAGVLALQRTGLLRAVLRDGVGDGGCAGAQVRAPQEVAWRFWHQPARRAAFMAGARDNLLFLGKWLVLAFVLESLMLAYVPAELVAGVAGGDGVGPVIAATVVGVPAYLNGYAALPLVAGLIEQGMSPGAGMAFLIAGGVSSVPAAIAVYALARPPVFAAYLGFAFVGATAAGLAYGAL